MSWAIWPNLQHTVIARNTGALLYQSIFEHKQVARLNRATVHVGGLRNSDYFVVMVWTPSQAVGGGLIR